MQIISLCQIIPGPSSSQIAILIGYKLAGCLGDIIALCAFLFTSVAILVSIALYTKNIDLNLYSGIIHSLKLVALVVVFDACISMLFKFCNAYKAIIIFILSLLINIVYPTGLIQFISILIAGIIGNILLINENIKISNTKINVTVNPLISYLSGIFFMIFLIIGFLPLNQLLLNNCFQFFKAGSLVFGGGPVVLPVLEQFAVPNLISKNTFLAGYGVTQAMPGPLFSFAAFIGANSQLL